jgi:uncharacterized BrkB/YihY/UPF0761 family membrane protein
MAYPDRGAWSRGLSSSLQEKHMFGIVYALLMISAFLAAMAAGAVGCLLLALAASVAGALIGAFLNWSEPMIWSALLAAPLVLLIGLTISWLLDRLSRNAQFHQRRRPEDFWPGA